MYQLPSFTKMFQPQMTTPYSSYTALWKDQVNQKNQRGLQAAQLKDTLLGQFNQAHTSAKTANETRYNDILAAFDGMKGNVSNTYANLGDQHAKDIGRGVTNAKAGNTQALVNSGMVGTTVLPSLNRHADMAGSDAMARLSSERKLGELMQLLNLGQQKTGVMERREDAYPDMSQLLQLLNAFGDNA